MAAHQQPFRTLSLLLFVMLSCFTGVNSARTKDKIYIDISPNNGCFRLLNATHQIGCGSAQDGNTGVVHYMQTEDDWDFVLNTGGTTPYVAVLDGANFTSVSVRRLTGSGRVSGIAVLSVNLTSKDLQEGFSADKSCPNDDYGKYHGCAPVTWNPTGSGLLFEDLSIPIFSITEQDDVDTIVTKCYEPFNKAIDGKARTYPLCAMQLKSAMTAAKDAETCIRRSNLVTNLNPITYCDPLGDKNILATLKAVPENVTRPNKSVIVVATRMDSLGMFYNEYPSADTSVTGIVTLLAAAKALWKLQSTVAKQANSKDVMFTFFQGEAFDYIGSSRMLYEMEKGKFPDDLNEDKDKLHLQKIQLQHIAQFVELSQVGMRQDEDSLWLHVDPTVRQNTLVESLLGNLTRFGNGVNASFKASSPSMPLPPASLQRFLMAGGESNLESFVITDHQANFTNKFYNSRLDLPSQILANYADDLNATEQYESNTTQSERITALATALARYLFWASTGMEPTAAQLLDLQADLEEVNHMLYCFLQSPHCELFNFTISPDNADNLKKNDKPFPFYVSISGTTNQVTYLVQHVLAYFTGTLHNVTHEEDCDVKDKDKRYTYLWMQGGIKSGQGQRTPVCYKSTVRLSTAESPAFDMDDYDWTSGQYSTWTESRWDDFKVRVFLVPSKQLEVTVLVVGVCLLVVSLVVMYFLNSKANILFGSPSASKDYRYNSHRDYLYNTRM